MTIECSDLKEFMDIIEGLVKRGLMFDAYASALVIKLTGGF